MTKKDDTSKGRPSRGHQRPTTSAAENDADSLPAPSRTWSQTPLVLAIEAERAQLLQAYALLKCLYETLLYADTEDAVLHADVANVAARLIDESVTRLDLARLAPMIEALRRAPTHAAKAAGPAAAEEKPATGVPGGDKVEDRGGTFRSYRVEDTGQVH
jgi:hypothetical protein